MTKHEVLDMFSQSLQPLAPNEICRRFAKFHCRSSVYSYLFRLYKQGLLRRGEIDGRIVYSISARGIERLNFFNSRKDAK
jgi:DNA-binding PadR family transcriptional regulator